MQAHKITENSLVAWFFLALGVLVIHGLLLINRGVYFDGVIYHQFVVQRNWEHLLAHFQSIGFPQVAYLHWFTTHFQDPVKAYKVMVFLSILASTLSIYQISRFAFDSGTSFLLAMLFVAYPGNQTYVETGCAQYPISYSLFLLGWSLVFWVENSNRAKSLLWMFRAIAGSLMLISFTVNSLLVFHFAFVLAFYWVKSGKNIFFSWKTALAFLSSHWFYTLLPLVFWTFKTLFFKPFGMYEGYNSIRIKLSMFKFVFRFLTDGVLYHISDLGRIFFTTPFLGIFLAIPICMIVVPYLISQPRAGLTASISRKTLGISSGLFFLLGALPYAVVKKAPHTVGWDTRHALLMGLPVALCILWSTSYLKTERAKIVFLVAILSGFSGIHWRNYLDRQARWVKDSSIVEQLKLKYSDLDFSTAIIRDEFPIQKDEYRYYEWNALLVKVWPDESRLGANTVDDAKYVDVILKREGEYWKPHHLLSNWSPKGTQVEFTVEKSDVRPNWKIGMESIKFELTNNFAAQRKLIEGAALVHLKASGS